MTRFEISNSSNDDAYDASIIGCHFIGVGDASIIVADGDNNSVFLRENAAYLGNDFEVVAMAIANFSKIVTKLNSIVGNS